MCPVHVDRRADLQRLAVSWLDPQVPVPEYTPAGVLPPYSGSVLEDAERLRGVGPRDIDVVTFANLKGLDRRDPAVRQAIFGRVPGCDAYPVNLANYSSNPWETTRVVQYWHGLFSHQRNGDLPLWKGFVEIPLSPDIDAAAATTLQARGVSDDTH